jgi:hypothetical protein
MARQIINVGAVANDGTGDALRFAFTKTNENFAELYNKDGDLTASIAAVANSVPTDVSQLTDTTERIPDRDYNRLFNKPFIPSDVSQLTDEEGLLGGGGTSTTITNLELTNRAILVTDVLLDTAVSFEKIDYDTSNTAIDFIDDGVALTRGNQGWLYNPFLDLSGHAVDSPNGTLWNGDDTTDLRDYRERLYVTLYDVYNGNFNEIVGKKLVMKDTVNDNYYLFEFTGWTQGQLGGGFSYNRSLILGDPGFFEKTDNGNEVDIFVADDPVGTGIGITRGNNQGIYNTYQENEWDSDVSPAGTLWNIEGWSDLSNLTERSYTNFYDAFGNGGLGNKVVGTECVMYIPSTEEYYAIKFLSWTQNAGGGFSYLRYEIDPTQIDEGIKFADGTILKSADGLSRVKSTAPRERRIEEVTGYKEVNVTEKALLTFAAQTSRSATNGFIIWLDSAIYTDISTVIDNPSDAGIIDNSTIQFSIDNVNWYSWNGGTSFSGTERGYGINQSVSYTVGDTLYFRYVGGGAPQVWWNKSELPGGSANFRGAVIDYHAYTGEATWIGTIHIVDDDGDENIAHTEVSSGSTDSENDDLWVVDNEGTIKYRRIDGEAKTLKVHWAAKVFYGSETYD